MTFTGIASSSASSGALARNARMNTPVVSAGRIFGAMPPPMNTPPVASVRSARLPASAPYASTNMSSVSTQPAQRPPRAAVEIAAGASAASRSIAA